MRSGWANLVLLALWLLLPLAALYREGEMMRGGVVIIALSCFAAYLIVSDKRRARAGEWRIPESGLHFVELCGGWPGSLLAQRAVRHKTAKLSYRLRFYGIIALYQIVAFMLLND